MARAIQQQFSFQKTRLRGLAKNRCNIHVLAALPAGFNLNKQLSQTNHAESRVAASLERNKTRLSRWCG